VEKTITYLLIVAGLAASEGWCGVRVRVNDSIAPLLNIDLEDGIYAVTTNTLAFNRPRLKVFSGGLLEAGPFIFTAIPDTARLEMYDTRSELKFRIDNAHIGAAGGNLHILNTDIMAASDVGEISIGSVDITTPWFPPPTLQGSIEACSTNFGPSIDVALTQITSLQQVARQAGVHVALSMATRLSNIGIHDVPWFWAINPPGPIMPVIGQHPYAVFHLYRLSDGVFRQIGKSDVKHAFYSSNSDCDCPGAQIIFSGCEDVYGVGNNADQFYFAPRNEVHVFSGSWESFGSHFDVTAAEPIPDDTRSHFAENNDFIHRLLVPESLLTVTDAQYFVESWYIVKGDTNSYNNIGWRRVTPSFNGSVWSFTLDTALSNGPAIDAFVPRDVSSIFRSHRTVDTAEGNIHLAVDVTSLGNSMYRYEYACMNMDFDHGIRALEFPVSSGLTITNTTFFDSDTDPANDWSIVVTNQLLIVSMVETNGLEWGSLFQFGFDANVPPSPGNAVLQAHLPGTTDVFRVESLTPGVVITTLSISGAAEVTWPSVSGAVYDLEYHDMIDSSMWTPLGPSITASAPLVVLSDTNPPGDRLFYRLQIKSAP